MDDQYYQQLSSSRSDPCIPAKAPAPDAVVREGSSPDRKQPAGQSSAGQVRERDATEPESHRTDGDTREVQPHGHQSANDRRSLPVSPELEI